MEEPALASGVGDGIGRVAHPQSWMSAPLGVGRGTAPVLREEEGQPLAGTGQIGLGVQRTQDLVGRHSLIENVNDGGQCAQATDLVVEAHA